ncbi:MAG: polysaccharide biosynthesis/export family protein [Gammaproteobacteria bacterium]
MLYGIDWRWLLSGLLATGMGCAGPVVQTPSTTAPALYPSSDGVIRAMPGTQEAALSAGGAQTNGHGVEDYRVGPQDLLDVNVFGVKELSGTVRVDARGFITLPLIGQVEAGGLTSSELEKRIADKLGENYLQNPNVTIFIKEFASQRVTIEGAVGRPGIYALSGATTLLQAIALAGGLGQLAAADDIKLFRGGAQGQKTMFSFDLGKIRKGEMQDPVLQGNDVVVVNKSGSREFLRDSLFRDTIDLLNPFKIFN